MSVVEKRKVYAVRHHGGNPCTQKQPDFASKAAFRNSDLMGGQRVDYILE